MTQMSQTPELGELKLLGQSWVSPKKFYCMDGFVGFDWCFQRNASLFGTLHRGGGLIE